MSTVKTNNVQIGQSLTASQNFTWYQPASPDGTVRLGNGNAGSVTDLVTLTSAGNLGLGVTPGSWVSSSIALQIGLGGAAEARNATLYDYLSLTGNARLGSGATYYYVGSSTATRYRMYAGQHDWYTAGSGTAGNAITFGDPKMTLDASGNLGIGTSSPGAASGYTTLDVSNATNGARIRCLVGSTAYGGMYTNGTTDFRIGSLAAVPLNIITGSNTIATFDTSGNLGLGVTPSAWGSGIKAFDISGGALVAVANTTEVHSNSYYNGTNSIYKATGFATKYTLNAGAGAHYWYTAGSGTAGNAITFNQAMTLDASGNLLVGVTGVTGGSSNTAKTVAGAFITTTGTTSSLASGSTTNFYTTQNNGAYLIHIKGNSDAGYAGVWIVWVTAGGIQQAKIGGHATLSLEQGAANTIALRSAGAPTQTYNYSAISFGDIS